MSRWLASVQSLQEAQSLSAQLPDILDMKNPATGALGKLDEAVVNAIVDWVAGRCLTSATVGDLPMRADLIADALRSMAATGVDYLKIGLFEDEAVAECLLALAPTLRELNRPVIAVVFADQRTPDNLMPLLKRSGFAGVMVDTSRKDGRSLRDLWTQAELAEFVEAARQQQLLCGLAGALRIEDIPPLAALQADYLGFRSALCADRRRSDTLQPELAAQIRLRLHKRNEDTAA